MGGVATFTNLYDDTAETITLKFSGGNLPTATSTAIIVGPSEASKLFVSQQPSSATAGQNFGTVAVEEVDQFGNVIASDSTSTVTVARGSVGTVGLQGANLTVTLVNGVATFSGLSYKKAETMDLGFSSDASGVSGATSGNIVVSPAAANHLVIETEPSSTATAGVAFQTQPVIYEEDPFGNLETGDNSTVVSAMQNTGRGPLDGTLNATVSGGIARFTNLADTKAETTMLSFVSGTMFSLATTPIVVSPGPATQLVTTPPPNSVVAGLAFTLVISAEDQFHNVASTFTGNLTVALAKNPGASTLGGTTTVAVIDGLATFSNLTLNNAGSGYTLAVSGNGPTATTTTPFNVISPTITGEQVVMSQKKNKKGKPVGASVLTGFTLDYGTTTNPTADGLLTVNYLVSATTTKRVKNKIVTGSQPVAVTPATTRRAIRSRCPSRGNHRNLQMEGRSRSSTRQRMGLVEFPSQATPSSTSCRKRRASIQAETGRARETGLSRHSTAARLRESSPISAAVSAPDPATGPWSGTSMAKKIVGARQLVR